MVAWYRLDEMTYQGINNSCSRSPKLVTTALGSRMRPWGAHFVPEGRYSRIHIDDNKHEVKGIQ